MARVLCSSIVCCAAMAQRRSELTKLETLERIAAFHSELAAFAERNSY